MTIHNAPSYGVTYDHHSDDYINLHGMAMDGTPLFPRAVSYWCKMFMKSTTGC
jgi:hypothetical protein